jgi:hypothetical protein
MPNLNEKMSTEQRKKLKKSDFIFPDRDPPAYPIPNEKQAQYALTMARWPQNKKDFKAVFAAVKSKFPKVAKNFMGGKFESASMGDHPVLRERLESIRKIVAEADDLASVDPGSITGMFVQEMCSKHDKKKRKGKKG